MNGFSIKLSFVQQYNKQGVVLGRLNGPENKTLFFFANLGKSLCKSNEKHSSQQ